MDNSPEDVISKVLAPHIKSAKRRDEIAEAIAEKLTEQGWMVDDRWDIGAVEVNGARVPIEQVTAYGLDISLDANGNAVEVVSPHGLVIA